MQGSGGTDPRIPDLGSQLRASADLSRHCIGGWIGPKTVLNAVVKGTFLSLLIIEPRLSNP